MDRPSRRDSGEAATRYSSWVSRGSAASYLEVSCALEGIISRAPKCHPPPCQRRDSCIKCLREGYGSHKKRPLLTTPLEWPESAIRQPWASFHSLTRQACQSPIWQPKGRLHQLPDQAITARKRRKGRDKRMPGQRQ